ncbi:MAG TPA: hypothetical protein VFE62_00385 [Gemmataceae bacterium]|nr:hypothetical protein [Gemmataceae bacterium]
MNRPFAVLVAAGAVMMFIVVGCRTTHDSQSDRRELPPSMEPTVLDYVDTDAFDVVFESALLNKDPVIIVRTPNEKPDWQGRLNAWIAAWNMGAKIEGRRVRGQIPAQIDAAFIKEFRELVFGLIERAEDLAKASSTWWHEDRARARRIALLRRYNLRFHMTEDKKIYLIFFNGDYSEQHAEFMTKLTGMEEGAWTRTVQCSMCEKYQPVSRKRRLPADGE